MKQEYNEAIRVLKAYRELLDRPDDDPVIQELNLAIELLQSTEKGVRDLGWKRALPFFIFYFKNYKKIPRAIEEWIEENPDVSKALELLVKTILGIDE